jgi:hypothetical protein
MISIEEKGTTISFSGVGAHHQNGIAEKRIVDSVQQVEFHQYKTNIILDVQPMF